MEKSKTKALCSHRMLDFLCFVLPPRCLSRIKARLARSFANNQHSRKQSGTTMLFLQQCVSLCEAWSRYAWLAGWLALIYIYKAHSCIPLPLSTPQPSQIPQTPIFPPQPPISPPQKKKKKWAASPPAPSPLKTPTLTLTALHAAGPLLRGESARTSTSTTRRCGRRRCGERCGTGPWRRRKGSFGGSTMSG